MATKLILKSESHYRDLIKSSTTEDTVIIEGYIEGDLDTIIWKFEQFAKFLLAEGYSIDLIKKYLNYEDGEVFELEDTEG